MLGAYRARSSVSGSGALAPRRERCAAVGATRTAGPGDIPPDYSDIDASPINQTIMALFRRKMVDRIGEDTEEPGYAGIIALTRKLNSMYKGTIFYSTPSILHVSVWHTIAVRAPTRGSLCRS